MNIGSTELLIVLAVLLLLFGAGRVPKLARSLGEASREFRKGVAPTTAPASDTPAPSDENRG